MLPKGYFCRHSLQQETIPEKQGCRVFQQGSLKGFSVGEGEKTAFATTFEVSPQLSQRQPRVLTEHWHSAIPAGSSPPGQALCELPQGRLLRPEYYRVFQGKSQKEDIFAFFPWGDLKQKYQISTPTVHGTYGTHNKSYASAAHLPVLSCAQVEASTEPSSGQDCLLRGCQEDSHFKTAGVFFLFGRHCKKMSIYKMFFQG